MSVRDLAAFGLIGGLGLYAWRMFARPDGSPAPLPVAPPAGEGSAYLAKLAAAENASRDPLAKNPRSTASGLWQFIERTWRAVGGAWGPDRTKPFGGLKPSVAEQNMRLGILTDQNAAMLKAAGIVVSDASLYAAHFLGGPVAIRVLRSADWSPLAPLVGSRVMTANKFPSSWTVGHFRAWLRRKMGS